MDPKSDDDIHNQSSDDQKDANIERQTPTSSKTVSTTATNSTILAPTNKNNGEDDDVEEDVHEDDDDDGEGDGDGDEEDEDDDEEEDDDDDDDQDEEDDEDGDVSLGVGFTMDAYNQMRRNMELTGSNVIIIDAKQSNKIQAKQIRTAHRLLQTVGEIDEVVDMDDEVTEVDNERAAGQEEHVSNSINRPINYEDDDDDTTSNKNSSCNNSNTDVVDVDQDQQQGQGTVVSASSSQGHRNSSHHQNQPRQPLTLESDIQLLMGQLEKLDPDKNGLALVTKEMTSSTLTTRLKSVCKINRLIDHAGDLCYSFTEINQQKKYQESTNKFRDWILQNKIIEHIFGPNCHVEIIKQSHTILNFVAHLLDDDHVNVIWSASLLKHCGRQVLDLLTSLVRSMKTGPVLHLYWLVKNLNVEDHSEHTLLLTSHILRYIWSHSPCINQMQFCNLQKNRHQLQRQSHVQDQETRQQPQQNHQLSSLHPQHFAKQQKLSRQSQFQHPSQEPSDQHSSLNHSTQHLTSRVDSLSSTDSSNTATNTTNTTTDTAANTKLSFPTINYEQYQLLTSYIFPSGTNEENVERSASSRSTNESVELDKELQQSLFDAIKGVTQQQQHQQHHPRSTNSPVNEIISKDGGGSRQSTDELKQSAVNHILKTISDNSSQSSSHQPNQLFADVPSEAQSSHDLDASDREWLGQELKRLEQEGFLDNTSDVSACCSEDKNMGDFDDESNEFMRDENIIEKDGILIRREVPKADSCFNHSDSPRTSKAETINGLSNRSVTSSLGNKGDILGMNESSSSSRGSDAKSSFYLDRTSEQSQNLPLEPIAQFKELKRASCNLSHVTSQIPADQDLKKLSEYNLANLSDPGKTLLWDLLQDGKIEHLAANLHVEIENVLVNSVMSFGDRCIRYKFIEACLENLSKGTSVIISLRLLPKLMSYNPVTRNLSIPAINETHTIVLWAECEYNMSQNFFTNLVEYYKQRQQLLCSKLMFSGQATAISGDQLRHLEEYEDPNCKRLSLFSHVDRIITRMSFLTFIYSKPFSPDTMKLSREQMDQLWDCLASDSNLRCSDVLFQWIYQQAVGDDFHGVNDELLDYVLKHKLPTLEPEHFRLRGLKLLEQLLWIRQDYECCHGLEHPATRLLWDIGLKAEDDEVSMAAIRILNHFYIYTNHQKSTKCDKGINFMNYCMDQLQSSLTNLNNLDDAKNVNHQLDVMQKVILLIRTHLEVFKAHWSYYLRILQLNNEEDLISHRLNAYDIKLTMTVRLVCQAASSMDKTTIEMQAGDFVGELRAEIVKWWYSQVDTSHFGNRASSSPSTSNSLTATNAHDTIEVDEKQQHINRNPQSILDNDTNSLNSFTEFLLANQRSLRLLSHNQEIPFEWDERQINELDFKEMQVIYVLNDLKPANLDTTDELESDMSTDSNQPNYLPKTEIPSILLLRYEYFERLMEADRFLGSFQSKNMDLTNRAKTLSRRVWEIIQILPTCPHYKEDLKRCGLPDDDWRLKSTQCSHLLSAECPQRLLYSLQIIDILKSSSENPTWGAVFIKKGGLADIYDVFMSQKLLPDEGEDWNEWLQECLAYLLKLLFQFGAKPVQNQANESSSSSSSSKMSVSTCSNRTIMTNVSSLKRARRNRSRILGTTEDRLPIPQFSEDLLKLLENTELIFNKLIWVLKSSALCKSHSDHYYVTMSSRAMIVHHVMSFLSSWCKTDSKFPRFQISNFEQLLKALILDDTDSSTRREACNGFFKLHHACHTKSANTSIESINSTINSSLDSSGESRTTQCDSLNEYTNWTFSSDLLKCLIKFLPIAESMKPPKPIRNYVSENDYIKELNSPGCKDYFWLTCRLIDSPATSNLISEKGVTILERPQPETSEAKAKDAPVMGNMDGIRQADQSKRASSTQSINLFELCEYLVVAIRNRQTYETRDFSVEDDTLRGMLLMMNMAIRRDPTFRYTPSAFSFIQELYEYLFAPPNQNQRYLPKCKCPITRSTAFDLMIALVERCPKNYFGLLELLLMDKHSSVVKGTYPNDYWPHEDCRSEVGFVGLINLGATCYLATCMQHLFMVPHLRYAILSIDDTSILRHSEIIRELQKIFTFMLESERKAYNPRNFCKVYTMDNHPLNIAEQTDMTEFLTDLITKLEESSPELRQIIKGLFSGTLSNNVVSLDCPHISRTTEEFYTLRVQVADMRNLNDSLDELTVKDTLEGDNMYTCSSCEKKVRAEKRACITKLPRILCFNTMRYTFNMATMTKEKVNTHFSFPLKLDMADYLETNLMKRQRSSNTGSCSSKDSSASSSTSDGFRTDKSLHEPSEPPDENRSTSESSKESLDQQQNFCSAETNSPASCSSESSTASASVLSGDEKQQPNTLYDLIGVTVHTGNADGGHYYCFIRDCEDQSTTRPRWYLFNDAEVKSFDDSHIGTECYGGELTTKSYDAINDRFMDFSIEKTNSAYMLFYKRVDYEYHSRSVALRYLESDTQRPSYIDREQASFKMNTDVGRIETKASSTSDLECQAIIEEGPASKAPLVGYQHSGDECSDSTKMTTGEIDFNELSLRTYEDFKLPKHLSSWIWADNMKFARDKSVFEPNYFSFMWQICANVPRTLNHIPDQLMDNSQSSSSFQVTEDAIAIRTVHLAIAFVLGVLMNSRERPNLSNWTELIRKQFNSSKAACDWLMHLIDDEETWLKQMLLKCPIEMIRQLFQRLCNDLTGPKQHKKLRLIR